MASPPRKQHRSRRRWWRGRGAGVRLAGRGEQRGFLDLVDRPLLVAVLDPAGLAGGAGGDRVQTKADGDQGRSAQRAAWHQRTSVRSSWLWECLTDYLGVGSWLLAPSLLTAVTSMRPGWTWMRLGLASSALGTRICSTPSSNDAWIPSAVTWAGRVIDRRKAP